MNSSARLYLSRTPPWSIGGQLAAYILWMATSRTKSNLTYGPDLIGSFHLNIIAIFQLLCDDFKNIYISDILGEGGTEMPGGYPATPLCAPYCHSWAKLFINANKY